ncbi:MAG: gliding motility-associated protein GldE [Cytophagales bacterium]|nr:gliding motility-associated protein GldE [Bernardetiaceae bacterium]MDW8204474.1 gliding motility-associated protein GldE [Cytophagales bacterium]
METISNTLLHKSLTVISALWLVYFVEGIFLCLLLLCSALISGSEVAFFSLKPQQLADCRNSSLQSERDIALLVSNPRKLLATVLILNNLVNISIVTLATYMVIDLIGKENSNTALVMSGLTVVVTFMIVFFGEVVPKVYSNQRALSFARLTATPILWLSKILDPLSFLLLQMSRLVESRMKRKGYNVSIEELNEALEITTNSEKTSDDEKEILKGIVNFSTITVKQIMQVRMDICAADIEWNFHELLQYVNEMGYSRMPVYRETIDKIEGILYVKDLLPHLEQHAHFEWQQLIRRNVFFVPENKRIDQLMKDFQARHVHIAIVVDEYGGTAGLITLEDIIEEIIGDINDEFDTRHVSYKRVDANTYFFEGKTLLIDFCRILNVDDNIFDEVKGESESLGGLLLELFARMPRVGEKKRFKNFVFTVMSADKKRIKNVRVFIKKDMAVGSR